MSRRQERQAPRRTEIGDAPGGKLPGRHHHIGIPTDIPRQGEVYPERFKTYLSGFENSPHGVEWTRFEKGSPVVELIQKVPHEVFQVDNPDDAIARRDLLITPKSPSEGVTIAFIVHNGAPIEFPQCDKKD
jgi:hypothetical protein